jgi:predicted lactoylglutathione lyase
MARQIFVNLPVKNLNKSIEFFTKLGFSFNQQFTDETATCMIVGEDIFVMLLTEAKFKAFTQRDLRRKKIHGSACVPVSRKPGKCRRDGSKSSRGRRRYLQ